MSERFHVTQRGASLRTKLGRRVPGSPPAYAPAPLHPVEDAVRVADELPATPEPVAERRILHGFGSVLRDAQSRGVRCIVHLKSGQEIRGLPRHEHLEFWSLVSPSLREGWGEWRHFFYSYDAAAVAVYEGPS